MITRLHGDGLTGSWSHSGVLIMFVYRGLFRMTDPDILETETASGYSFMLENRAPI